jgi:hypothetical protein
MTTRTRQLVRSNRGFTLDILNGEIVAALTGWQAVGLAAVAFAVASLVRRLRHLA